MLTRMSRCAYWYVCRKSVRLLKNWNKAAREVLNVETSERRPHKCRNN